MSARDFFSPPRLKRTWRFLRKEITKAPFRDCIDYLEIDVFSDEWLGRLSRKLVEGTYRPQEPGRREAAKSGGAFRVITAPAIDDVLAYRHIADSIYETARLDEPPGAYFSRRHRHDPVGAKVDEIDDDDYETFFRIWLRYSNYRKLLLLSGLYEVIVVTDISNYFDTIQHSLLLEYLAPYSIPREALGILSQILDVLRPVAGHSSTPAVGLPIDVFDCSRILAHVFLFEHDRRMSDRVGEHAYVRWMDDQNLGVKSQTEARAVVRYLTQSLNLQRLTVNSSKTSALPPAQVATHFWLEANDELDVIEDLLKAGLPEELLLDSLTETWVKVRAADPRGHWDKVMKRMFGVAGRLGSDVATYVDCQSYLVSAPTHADRIFDYLVARERYDELIDLFNWFLDSGNSLYEDVEALWFESVLVASPPPSVVEDLQQLAVEFVRGTTRGTRRLSPRTPAALLLYWLDHAELISLLETMLRESATMDGTARRAITAVLCARSPEHLDRWIGLASRQASTQVSSLLEWVGRLRDGDSMVLPEPLVFVRRPWLLQRYVYDARAWLRLELLATSSNADVRASVGKTLRRTLWNPLQSAEARAAKRVADRLQLNLDSPGSSEPSLP